MHAAHEKAVELLHCIPCGVGSIMVSLNDVQNKSQGGLASKRFSLVSLLCMK